MIHLVNLIKLSVGIIDLDMLESKQSITHSYSSAFAPNFDKQTDREEQYLMKQVCGEAFNNVVRDN
jgi:hypothetical protein